MPAESEKLLSADQRRIVGFSLTFGTLVGALALLIGVFIVLGRLIGVFSGVLWPLCVAGVLALILRPLVMVLERKLHLRRTLAVVVLYVFVVLVVAGLLLLILPPLIDQMIEFLTSYLPTFWDDVVEYSQSKFPQWIELARLKMTNPAIKRAVEAMASEGQEILSHALPSLRAAGGGVLGIFGFATHLAIVPVYLFFFLLSRGGGSRSLRDQLPFLSEGLRDDFVFLVHEFVGIVESFFRGQLIIGFIMGILLVIGFSIVGLKFALLLGLLIGMLNVVPYLGTIVGLALVIPTAFFQPNGGWKLVALVLLVKIIVQAVEGWFLTPKIMGQRTGLHPIMIIVAIFFWGTAFDGILGMVLAIPLTAFFVTVWRLMQRKYFRRVPAN